MTSPLVRRQRRYRTCQRVKEDSEGFRAKCNKPTTSGRRYCFDCRVWYQQNGEPALGLNGGLPSAGE